MTIRRISYLQFLSVEGQAVDSNRSKVDSRTDTSLVRREEEDLEEQHREEAIREITKEEEEQAGMGDLQVAVPVEEEEVTRSEIPSGCGTDYSHCTYQALFRIAFRLTETCPLSRGIIHKGRGLRPQSQKGQVYSARVGSLPLSESRHGQYCCIGHLSHRLLCGYGRCPLALLCFCSQTTTFGSSPLPVQQMNKYPWVL